MDEQAMEKVLGVELEPKIWTDDWRDQLADLLSRFEELNQQYEITGMANLVEAVSDTPPPPPRKRPRPPKCTGPVNKANYAANRPQRVARSSCRTIKR